MEWVAAYVLCGAFIAVFNTKYNGASIFERMAAGTIIVLAWPLLVLCAVFKVTII